MPSISSSPIYSCPIHSGFHGSNTHLCSRKTLQPSNPERKLGKFQQFNSGLGGPDFWGSATSSMTNSSWQQCLSETWQMSRAFFLTKDWGMEWGWGWGWGEVSGTMSVILGIFSLVSFVSRKKRRRARLCHHQPLTRTESSQYAIIQNQYCCTHSSKPKDHGNAPFPLGTPSIGTTSTFMLEFPSKCKIHGEYQTNRKKPLFSFWMCRP